MINKLIANEERILSMNNLEILASLIRDGKIKSHIEKTYPFQKIPEAIGYIESMHTKGKVAMVWGSP